MPSITMMSAKRRAYAVFHDHLFLGVLNAVTAWALLVLLVRYGPLRWEEQEDHGATTSPLNGRAEVEETEAKPYNLFASYGLAGAVLGSPGVTHPLIE